MLCTARSRSQQLTLLPSERIRKEVVRFRTIGDMSCTGAVKSDARTLDEVIAEVAAARITARRGLGGAHGFTGAPAEDRTGGGYLS